ncbi:hypothetical protein P3181_004506 [Escherichia coli]|nr:hypothetical protein [Escherichia coli]
MSQYSIQQSLGNASGVAVSPINADATLSTGVVLNSSLWAGIGVFAGSDSNLLIVFYVQIMPDDLVMQLHRF